MIFRPTQTGRGVHVILSKAEATSLAAVVANGEALNQRGHELRIELLKAIGQRLYGNDNWYLRLPSAAENQKRDIGQMGIVKLIQQAQADPALRDQAKKIVVESAQRLDRLLRRTSLRHATPSQMVGM